MILFDLITIVKGGENVNKKIAKITVLFIIFTMVLVSISSATACTLADSQWPKDGHDNQNTGQSQYLGPQNNSTKWTKNLSEDISTNPIIGPDGTVYLGTYDDTIDHGKLYAFNPNSTVKWNYTVTDGEWTEISSTPAISSEGTIFFATNFADDSLTNEHGNLYALSQTGEYLWNYTIPGLESCIYSSPAIGSDGTVYFLAYISNVGNTVANLFALTKDGALKWNYTFGDTCDGKTHSPVIGQDGTIYIGVDSDSDNGVLYALNDAADHAVEKWSYVLSGGDICYSWILNSPAIGSDGTIYFGAGFNTITHEAPIAAFYAITDAGNHAMKKWEYIIDADMSLITSPPAIAKDGTIYFGYYLAQFETGFLEYMGLKALTDDETQALEKWSFDTEYLIGFAPAIGSDGTVYFGDDGTPNTFYGLNSDGTVKWSLIASPITAAAISKVGTLYFGSYDRPDASIGPVIYAIQGPPSSLYVKTSVDNANPVVGDTVTITYYVGNNGPNTAYNTVLKFVIPAGMKFVKAWTSYPIGSISYDATTNTVTWDLGDLPIIDPEAWVQLIAQAAGEIIITPSITTLTDDPTISSHIQSITINVHAATNSAATTNTVGMQSTGMPLAMLFAAILMVLGGSLIPRRKK